MRAGRWGQRAEVGAAARERALASGTDLWDLPVSQRKRRGVKRGLARGDRWARRAGDGVTGQIRREGRAESWAAALARALALSGRGRRAGETDHAGREGRVSGWATGPRGKEVGRQVWAAWVGLGKREGGQWAGLSWFGLF